MIVSLHWDYYDHVHGLGAPYGAQEMAALCGAVAAAGVDRLNFRVESCGMAWVPSPARPLFDRFEPERALPQFDFSRHKAIAASIPRRVEVARQFRRTYERCPDPLAAAAAAARDAGLGLNVYVCPYDQYWPGVPDTLVEAHPERCIQGRDGRSLCVPSLAYPANRRWLLAYYDAVLDHDIDDVVVYTGSHAWYSFPTDTPDDWFGFEPPAVEDYLTRTGIDVRSQPFDIDDYYRHYGTYWTILMQALAERQARRGHRLIVGMDLGPWEVHLPWGAPRLMTTWRHANDWRRWTGWGNVDLCAGHQHNIWEYERWPANRMACMPGDATRPPYLHAEETFGRRSERAFQLYAFLTLHTDRADHEFDLAARGTRAGGYDGLLLREAANFEFELGWRELERLVNMVKGRH